MFTVKLEIKDCHKVKASGMLGCIQGADLHGGCRVVFQSTLRSDQREMTLALAAQIHCKAICIMSGFFPSD